MSRTEYSSGKNGFAIRGLDDGGVIITFDDHPAHHRLKDLIEVSFGAKDIRRMRKLAKNAVKEGQTE